MYFPGPPLQPLVSIQNLDSYLAEFEDIGNLSAGIGVFGSAAAYALVWELGSRRAKKPGPKTLWSINRNNQVAILSKQAPFGYVGVVEDAFWPIIQKHINTVSFSNQQPRQVRLALEVAIDNASTEIARLVSEGAPRDSGTLASQIQAITTDEANLLQIASSRGSKSTIIL